MRAEQDRWTPFAEETPIMLDCRRPGGGPGVAAVQQANALPCRRQTAHQASGAREYATPPRRPVDRHSEPQAHQPRAGPMQMRVCKRIAQELPHSVVRIGLQAVPPDRTPE